MQTIQLGRGHLERGLIELSYALAELEQTQDREHRDVVASLVAILNVCCDELGAICKPQEIAASAPSHDRGPERLLSRLVVDQPRPAR